MSDAAPKEISNNSQADNCQVNKDSPSWTHHLQQILELHRQGVLILRKGENSLAIKVMHEALEALQGLVVQYAQTPLSQHTTRPTVAAGTASIEAISTTSKPSSAASDAQINDLFLLFDRALLLNIPVEQMTSNFAACFHVLTLVLTYNIGLAHQLHSLRCTCSRTLEERALDCYSAAYASLRQTPASIAHQPMLHMVHLAVVNNMGHLYAHSFRQYQLAQECTQELLWRLVAAPTSSTLNASSDLFHVDAYSAFFQNAYLFEKNHFITASTA